MRTLCGSYEAVGLGLPPGFAAFTAMTMAHMIVPSTIIFVGSLQLVCRNLQQEPTNMMVLVVICKP